MNIHTCTCASALIYNVLSATLLSLTPVSPSFPPPPPPPPTHTHTLTQARPRVLQLYATPRVLENLDMTTNTNEQFTPQHTHLHNSSSHPHLDVIADSHETIHEEPSEVSSLHPVHSHPHPIDSAVLTEMFRSDGPTWKAGSFCDDFFEKRYRTSVDVCGPPRVSDQVKCFWHPQNAHAATCDIDNLMVQPDALWKAMQAVNDRFPGSKSIWMIQSDTMTCPKPTISQ